MEKIMFTKDMQKKLIMLAKEVEENSYTPYSKCPVGAALITENNEIYLGCNIDNISFSLTNCAERTAIFKMISEQGPKAKIKAIAVTTKSNISCSPCGACRQVIKEFSTLNTIIIYKAENDFVSVSIDSLLPNAFIEFIAIEPNGSLNHVRGDI